MINLNSPKKSFYELRTFYTYENKSFFISKSHEHAYLMPRELGLGGEKL
jgi:hypothetical protein